MKKYRGSSKYPGNQRFRKRSDHRKNRGKLLKTKKLEHGQQQQNGQV